jgi:PEP-CTERM motif
MIRRIIHAQLAVICLSIGLAMPAQAAVLSDLISQNQSIQVGDLLFSGFTYSQTGDMPVPASINVSPYISGSGQNGLSFQAAFLDFPGGSGSDGVIGYHVTELTQGAQINGSTLSGVPTVLGGNGVVSVTESFLPTDNADLFSIYSISPGSTQTSNSLGLAGAFPSIAVQDSVLAFSGGGAASVSFFNATFSTSGGQIPEPASATLLGLGVALLAWRRLRNRK